MLTPFRFFWSKILPISYENYLSETEILEALKEKINTVITEIQSIEKFLSEDLDVHIDESVKSNINQYYKTIIKPELNQLQVNIDNLSTSIDERLNELKALIDDGFSDADFQLNDLYEKYEHQEEQINTLRKNLLDNVSELNARIDFATQKAEKDLSIAKGSWALMLEKQYRVIIRYCENYFKDLSSTTILVKSAVTGKEVTLQYALEEIVQLNFHTLTAREYRALELTAKEYRELYLTAFEYRMYGVKGAVGKEKEPVVMFDYFGRKVEQPLSSGFSVFADGITADMGNLDITAEQYRLLSENHNALELDKYGAYILRNNYNSLYRNVIHLKSQDYDLTLDYQRLTVPLFQDEDNNIVNSVSLLTQKSVNYTLLNEHITVQDSYTVDDKTYNVDWSSGSYLSKIDSIIFLNGALYAIYNIFNSLKSYEVNDITDVITTPLTLKVVGITTTK